MADIIYSQDYARDAYGPPVPVLDVGVSRPGLSTASVSFEAIVDTGADNTLIPVDILELAQAPYVDRAYLRGITGERQPVNLYLVTLHIASLRIPGIRAAALPQREPAILGRDVLNQLYIGLDGPAGITEVLE